MKYSEIRELTTKVSLRMNHKISDLDNPHQITDTKRFIARLKTELRQREINENKSK